MFCRKCGAELKEGALFCPKCGTPVKTKETPAAETPASEQAVPVNPAEPEAAQPAETQAAETPVAEQAVPVNAAEPEAAQPAEAPAVETLASEQAVPVNPAEPEAAQPAETPAAAQPAESLTASLAQKAGKKKEKLPKTGKKNMAPVVVLVIIILLIVGAGVGCGIYFTSDGYNSKKNMRLAQKAYEAEDYKEALGYYKDAMRLDGTLIDAYLKASDIYILQEEYDDAIELLKEKGLKKNRRNDEAKELLTAKLAEVYLAKAEKYLEENDYNSTLWTLDEGIDETGDAALTAKKSEVYTQWADYYVSQDDYYNALWTLDNGASVTGDTALTAKKSEVYIKWADYYMSQNDYYSALWALDDGVSVTGDTALTGKKSEVYMQWAENYVSQGYYDNALRTLDEGLDELVQAGAADPDLIGYKANIYQKWAEDLKAEEDYAGALEKLSEGLDATGDASLAEQKAQLQQSLKVVKVSAYNGWSLAWEDEYDEAGNVISSFEYSWGSVQEGYEAEYDASGNLVRRTQYSDGRLSYIVTYDDKGAPVDQTWYDRYGTQSYHETAQVKYNDAGKVEWIFWIGDDSQLDVQIQHLYDGTGNLIALYRYGADSSLISGYAYQDGSIAREMEYVNGEIDSWTDYTYLTTESGIVYVASEITYRTDYYGEEYLDIWKKYEYEIDDMGYAKSEICYYGYDSNYDATMSNGYVDYEWTYKYEYRYTGL